VPSFSTLVVGDELEPLTKALDRVQLVKYAAGSDDFNPLHYDPEFSQAREIGDNIVHGRLKYTALGQLVSDRLGHAGFIRRLSARYRGMDRRGETFTCRDRVTAVRGEDGRRLVELELWTESAAGRRTTVGAAEVVLDA
jgi:acyl dehydratase